MKFPSVAAPVIRLNYRKVGMEGVYLLHFDRPYKHAKHYVGWSSDIESRLLAHKNGRGARLIEVISNEGIAARLVRVWPRRTRRFERQLKRNSHIPAACPECKSTAGKGRWPAKEIEPHKAIIENGKCIKCRRKAHMVLNKFTRHNPIVQPQWKGW